MKFETIFDKQREFTQSFFSLKHCLNYQNFSSEQKEEWTKKLLLSMIRESTDLLDSFDWRLLSEHNNTNKNSRNILENGIDVLKYLLEILIINGFSSDDLQQEFFNKSMIVENRLKQEQFFGTLINQEIALIDIDGVLSTYPQDFLKNYGHGYTTLEEFKNKYYRVYLESKKRYRESGEKVSLGVKEGAQQFLHKLRDNGIKIILLTSRPVQTYPRIYLDTMKWLSDHDLYYDCIIWEEEKEKYALTKLKDKNIVFCIDDQQANIIQYHRCGYKSILLENPLLGESELYKEMSIFRVETLDQLSALIEKDII